MAASLFILLFLPCLLPCTGAALDGGAVMSSEASLVGPHFTSCSSRELETFRCWWNPGDFQNLSEPAALRVFFMNARSIAWRECPEYSVTVPNECYFNKSYTEVWVKYCVELRSGTQNITYHKLCFDVQDIVRPDPPVQLNWTLLSVSRSGLHFDIIVHWEPPPSADVRRGWMTLAYEVQYRERNATQWNTVDQNKYTQESIYGLFTGIEYEVRVRCKMRNFENYGDFSESVVVYIQPIPTKESQFPLTRVLIFAAVGVGILLLLIVFSQQHKLMVILLPPIPAPKIKGIDPELLKGRFFAKPDALSLEFHGGTAEDLLKKGKLEELSSILGSHHMYQPEPYQEDSWVEFIEVDACEACDKLGAESDTQRLLGSASGLLGLKDDDSGRASCYDPEFPDAETPELPSSDPLAHPKQGPGSARLATPGSPTAVDPAHQPVQTLPWINMDFYAQVSDVTPSGGVVLSPNQLERAPKKTEEEKKKGKEGEQEMGEKEKEKEEERGQSKKKAETEKFEMVVVEPEGGAYTSERDAQRISTEFSPSQGYTSTPLPVPTPAPGGYLLIQDAPCPPPPSGVRLHCGSGCRCPTQPPPEPNSPRTPDFPPTQPHQASAPHASGVPVP